MTVVFLIGDKCECMWLMYDWYINDGVKGISSW